MRFFVFIFVFIAALNIYAERKSCMDILIHNEGDTNGIYSIDPDGENNGNEPFDVYCDMTTNGGGWTLVATMADDNNHYWTWNNISNLYNGNTYGDINNALTNDFQSRAWSELIGNQVMTQSTTTKYIIYSDILDDETLASKYTAGNDTVPQTYYTPSRIEGDWTYQCSPQLGLRLQSPDSDGHDWAQASKGFVWMSDNNNGCSWDDGFGGLNNSYYDPNATNPDAYIANEYTWNQNAFYHNNFGGDSLKVFVRQFQQCGNGIIEGEEECDDANIDNNDGCSSLCDVEKDWECADANFSLSFNENFDGDHADDANWTISSDERTVSQTVNSNPSIYVSNLPVVNIPTVFTLEVKTTGDDDFIGWAIGYEQGENDSNDIDWILFDWKQGDQNFGGMAYKGLNMWRVHDKIDSNTDAWAHGAMDHLAAGINNGSIGWADNTKYTISMEYSLTNIKVWVNGSLEFDVDGIFPRGNLSFYTYSQPNDEFTLTSPIKKSVCTEVDSDGDGLSDIWENNNGTDRNNPDSDNDGVDDLTEVENLDTPRDTDGDNIIDALDDDDDGDGILTEIEDIDNDTDPRNDDTDGDSIPNYLDDDDDDDGDKTITDCAPLDNTIHHAADEIWYDGVDQNCDGDSDYDQDKDGEDSNQHGGNDCNDVNPNINTSADEIWYDGVDQDCSGGSDYDQDGDGEDSDQHGGNDCVDTNGMIYSTATEICDGVDNNCDTNIDENVALVDADNQNGICGGSQKVCDGVNGYIEPDYTLLANYNANDSNCDNVDNNCSGIADDGYVSTETSCGVGACNNTGSLLCVSGITQDSCTPLAPSNEICDGLDNDCNGTTDEGFNNLDNDSLADCVDPDDDNDGINDKDENGDALDNCQAVYNPNQTDTDLDGFGDLCDDDDDNDGINDLDENGEPLDNCQYIRNGANEDNQLDTDEDGIGDVCDSDNVVDTDNDGINDLDEDGNPLDNCVNTPNINQLDLDNDGIGDVCDDDLDGDDVNNDDDNCVFIANGVNDSENQVDTDNDGLGDICDNDNPDDIDTDNDGEPDVTDNCPLVPNTDQANNDNDELGDVCDSDDDNDNVNDSVDNCPLDANMDQANKDSDEFGDVCDDDDDNDGLLDDDDNCPLVASDNQTDTDNDGIGDLCDDSDNDGFFDNEDNCLDTYNPNQSDVDLDGLGDLCDEDDDNDGINDLDENGNSLDNCQYISNADQLDTDNDGIGDLCDPDNVVDIDGDGVNDLDENGNPLDNCVNIPNFDQIDTDNDGLGDVCDDDIDNDTILNDDDNCRLIANTDQSDIDNDGLGDVCDNDSQLDKDNDGEPDLTDNCPQVANTNQLDTDSDGFGDLCDSDDDNDDINDSDDNCLLIVNTDQLDIDNDGIGDVCDDNIDITENAKLRGSSMVGCDYNSSSNSNSYLMLLLLGAFLLVSRKKMLNK